MSKEVKYRPCPYKELPDTSYWRKSVGSINPSELDPVLLPKFFISAEDRVATAGSCFAQHIARYIRQSGYNYFVTESGHPVLGEEILIEYNYGTFSARYGNIYSTRQLLQLFERAYSLRKPVDDYWESDGRFFDPYRPFIQPEGFSCLEEFQTDREVHYSAVRQIVEESEVFVFTLGLTEAWENAEDGTVYAMCPGCGIGSHDPEVHKFHNFDVIEVTEDLHRAIVFLKEKNPEIKVLLTVSPVPLIATFEEQHILTATTYSKSVLRVAAQNAVNHFDNVDYFPSYEIITGNITRGSYYADNLRDIEEEGVAHAMRCFFTNYLQKNIDKKLKSNINDDSVGNYKKKISASAQINNVICDEERLEDF